MVYCGRSCFMCVLFFFFKQKTAYEMRISDWSSDVCSSDLDTSVAVFLVDAARQHQHRGLGGAVVTPAFKGAGGGTGADVHDHAVPLRLHDRDRRAQAVVDALQEIGRAHV